MMEISSLQESYNYADALMKKKAVNFYHAFKNLDESRFRAILGVYAFCRYVDDLVDEEQGYTPQTIRKMLLSLKSEIGVFYRNKNAYLIDHSPFITEPWFRGFIDSLQRFPIQESALYSQIEGQLSDLDFEPIKTFEALLDYSQHVAGSVGLILMPMIVDNPEDNMSDACIALGIAMQITNILRDIGEDSIERNRVYLPSEVLSVYQITPDFILNLAQQKEPVVPANFIDMWESLAVQAEQRYDVFNQQIMRFDKGCRLALLVASYNYRAILDSVRKNAYNCLTERCYTSKIRRIKILKEAQKALND